MSSKRICVVIGFPDIPEPVADLWLVLAEFLRNQKCLPKQFEISQISGHVAHTQSEEYLKPSPEEIRKLIAERKLNGFWVSAGRFGALRFLAIK